MRTPSKPRYLENSAAAQSHELTAHVGGRDVPGFVAPLSSVHGEIAFALVHEIKQPLAAVGAEIAACRNWLSAAPTELPPIFASFEAIREDVSRASHLLNRLNGLLAPTAVSAHCQIEPIVNELVDTSRAALGERGFTLAASCATHGYRAQADADELRQVLWSLLLCVAQAGHAAPAESRVLALRTNIERAAGRSFACLTIDQGGPGLLDDASRLPAFSSSALPGAVISLCRLLLERHGGRLHVGGQGERGVSLRVVLAARES